MATQDIVIRSPELSSRRPHPTLEAVRNDDVDAGPQLADVVRGVLRRPRKVLIGIVLCCLVAGSLAALVLGRASSTLHGTVVYTGLPGASRSYEPLPPVTCAEMMTSSRMYDALRESLDLDLTYADFKSRLVTKANSQSMMMNVFLNWGDADEGIVVLNKILNLFSEEIADQRRATLRKHVADFSHALDEAHRETTELRDELSGLRSKQMALMNEGGLANDRYRSVLDNVSRTELAIDEMRVTKLGVEQQVDALEQQIREGESAYKDNFNGLKEKLTGSVLELVELRRKFYSPESKPFLALNALEKEITDFDSAREASDDFTAWKASLADIVKSGEEVLAAENLVKWEADAETVHAAASPLLTAHVQEINRLEDQRKALALSLIPVTNQIEMLEQRLVRYQSEASRVAAELGTVGPAAVEESEQRLAAALSKENTLAEVRDEMVRLEQSPVREMTIASPASDQSAIKSSNRGKWFVIAFGACGLALVTPLAWREWSDLRPSPQVQFAKSLQLPVIADRLLQGFSTSGRMISVGGEADAFDIEALRALTLRIQQSAYRPGSVVLFSGMHSTATTAPLISAVARCLAERQESVLIIDAVSCDRRREPGFALDGIPSNLDAIGADVLSESPSRGNFGLAEFLSGEADPSPEVARPGGCAGIDIISSGDVAFSREAMASGRLTQLIESCRERYTFILLNGPPCTSAADAQMLAARADGIILTAGRQVAEDRYARSAVVDLIELGAPIIGVVT
jgi:Mrp family chromosome partitioning ATPase